MQEEYKSQPVRDGTRTKEGEPLRPNTFAAIRNTQRSAWTTNGIGPFLVVNGSGNTIRLQNLSNGQIITEARENVLPLHFTVGTRARILDANK